MNPSPRVTLKRIAQEAKLSIAAVSMALRDHPRIGKATCMRVQKLAASMGYQPDPALSALVAYRQDSRVRPAGSVIAVVYVKPEEFAVPERETREELSGIRETAERLGYGLDTFSTNFQEADQARVMRVIKNRGIRGIIFQFLDSEPSQLKADWGFVPAVGLGIVSRDSKLPLPIVCGDHFHSSWEAMRQIGRKGYKRPALLMPASFPAFLQHEILGGYLVGLRQCQGNPEPCDFEVNFSPQAPWREEIASFLKTHKPDVLISAGRASSLFQWLAKDYPALVKKTDVCTLDAVPEDHTVSGILQDRHGVGSVAMENLHKLILANVTGPSERSQATYIPPTWREGQSLGSRKTRPAKAERKIAR